MLYGGDSRVRWMLRRELWVDELAAKFPTDHWDHFMRASAQHRGRDCVCPFLSRNRNIGQVCVLFGWVGVLIERMG